MEIYETTTTTDCDEVSSRLLQALKDADLLGTNETKYCNGLSSSDGKFGIPIWPNDTELSKNYRDTIIGELTTEEETKLKTIQRDDVLWFPGVKSENDTRTNI
jgi:hypothetical protein